LVRRFPGALPKQEAAFSAVAFFSSCLNVALRRDAAQLLGGDLAISGDNPLLAPSCWPLAGRWCTMCLNLRGRWRGRFCLLLY
jgi:hypothetical protein